VRDVRRPWPDSELVAPGRANSARGVTASSPEMVPSAPATVLDAPGLAPVQKMEVSSRIGTPNTKTAPEIGSPHVAAGSGNASGAASPTGVLRWSMPSRRAAIPFTSGGVAALATVARRQVLKKADVSGRRAVPQVMSRRGSTRDTRGTVVESEPMMHRARVAPGYPPLTSKEPIMKEAATLKLREAGQSLWLESVPRSICTVRGRRHSRASHHGFFLCRPAPPVVRSGIIWEPRLPAVLAGGLGSPAFPVDTLEHRR